MIGHLRPTTAFAVCLGVLLTTQAMAQTPTPASPRRGPGLRDPYITSTGETVDKPGQSQSAGTTKLDRKIQRQNDKIDRSICKGC